MASAHVIEVGEITAGIVVLEHGGFGRAPRGGVGEPVLGRVRG
jgi:hypothetical protein